MGAHYGTLIDGDPIVCGHGITCFHYERGTKKWKRVNLFYNFDTDTENI